jgi:hypothetical protein
MIRPDPQHVIELPAAIADSLRCAADLVESGSPVPAALVAQIRAWLRSVPGEPIAKPPVPPPQYRRRSL